ncbi:hypothetical protein [Novosphingobium sp. TCA1]|uniref:PepSY domain-containing protein n=1 Tax=Novosphingobium pentaromativorans TaxID=205844 RepID=A0A2W5QK31_9SPHN|nr:hypothetical protein [Novosphingobium sp. TCA1]PZQ51830.1 MAG: hypothetical protein DI555_20750 [Novosphingobium pentaromativorans]GFE76912.1 hypothetical protein NTCA1_45610 [Novosphingobium sp. TCA1]
MKTGTFQEATKKVFHMRILPRSAAVAALAALLAPSLTHAQSTGLEDMVGARAAQADAEIQRRGYRNVGGEKGDDRSYAYWWSEARHQCVSIATKDGRFDSVMPTTPPDCRQDARSDHPRSSDRGPIHPPVHHGYVAADELSRICRNEAAAAFDRRPSEVTANAPIQQRSGYLVQGWYDRRDASKGTKFFNCRFDIDGRFLTVN